MTAYVIYQGEVLDPVRYEEFKIKAAESILRAGGRYLVRGGDAEVLEGDAPAGRTVVLKFQSMQDAIAWYRSDEYSEIRKLREGRRGLGCTPLKGSPDEPVLSASESRDMSLIGGPTSSMEVVVTVSGPGVGSDWGRSEVGWVLVDLAVGLEQGTSRSGG